MSDVAIGSTRQPFALRFPSVMIFLALLALFTVGVTILSEGFGVGVISTSFIKTLGKTLCLCLVALAMDLVWGCCGILSLGHMAPFGLGGYAIGMWLMYARTEIIVLESLAAAPLPPTPQEISDGIASQIFGVVGASEFPPIWAFAHSLPLQLAAVVLVPGLLALVFGWLAFRSRVTGVYLSILTQAMTLALSPTLFQNDSGLRGNNGAVGPAKPARSIGRVAGYRVALVLLGLRFLPSPSATCCAPGLSRASSGLSSAPSAMTKRACGSWVTRSRHSNLRSSRLQL